MGIDQSDFVIGWMCFLKCVGGCGIAQSCDVGEYVIISHLVREDGWKGKLGLRCRELSIWEALTRFLKLRFDRRTSGESYLKYLYCSAD